MEHRPPDRGQAPLRFALAVAGAWVLVAGPAAATGLADLSATVWITAAAGTPQTTGAAAGVGFTFTVTAEVTNPGSEAAKGVGPTNIISSGCPVPSDVAVASSGGGAVTLLSGPNPSCTAFLNHDDRAFYTWIYRADVRGAVDFTVSFSGRQTVGPPVTISGAGRADTATVTLRDAELSLDLVNPLRATVGQTHLPVTARVTNGGLATARSVFALSATMAGCPQPPADLGAGGNPGGSVTLESRAGPVCGVDLAPGASAVFTWYFTASRSGAVAFSVTCAGLTTLGTFVVSAAAASTPLVSDLVVQTPPRLGAAFSAAPSWSVPYQGQVTLYLDVTNTGEATADEVAPGVLAFTGPGRLGALPCPPVGGACPVDPAGAGSTSVPGSESRRFTWVYRGDGMGTLTVTGAAAGVDRNTRAPAASAPASLPLQVEPPAILSLSVTGGLDLVPGQEFTLTVAVINPGATPVVQSAFAATLNGDASFLTLVSAAPALPRRYEACAACGAGAELDCCRYEYVVTFRLSASAPVGPAVLALTAAGADTTGRAVVSAGSPLALQVYPAASKLAGISANPFHPAAGPPAEIVFVVAPQQGGEPASLGVYTLTGELVRTLAAGARDAGVWREPWDGRNEAGQRVASGVYLVLYRTRGTHSTARLAVIK